VVNTGPWIVGRKVLIPAGTVRHVDHESRTAHLDRTRTVRVPEVRLIGRIVVAVGAVRFWSSTV
jgi:hypothetical protein